MAETWLKCSACRTDIAFSSKYFQCSVSTCNRARTRLVFCSVACWDSHVATARHRDAWAEDHIAPTRSAWDAELAEQIAVPDKPSPTAPSRPTPVAAPPPPPSPAPIRRVFGEPPAAAPVAAAGSVALQDVADRDILIVMSKLKKYIKDRSGMNCSDAVAEVLSDHVRALCDDSIRAAGRDERKTVLDRDVPRPRR
jgi:histone H3/H4